MIRQIIVFSFLFIVTLIQASASQINVNYGKITSKITWDDKKIEVLQKNHTHKAQTQKKMNTCWKINIDSVLQEFEKSFKNSPQRLIKDPSLAVTVKVNDQQKRVFWNDQLGAKARGLSDQLFVLLATGNKKCAK
ncbi:MAG: hypothetical protein WCG27_05595 [Pseudomonadota bacterium]